MCDGREVWVRSYPLPIDYEATRGVARRPRVREFEERVLARRREYAILRVDRADLSKNVLRGFSAFDIFLEQHPEFAERITFTAQLMPSRTDVPEYAEYLEKIEALVAVVNHRHGTPDWMPIDLKLRDDLDEAVASYKHYDVMMVNAMFDGMNLVAKEGPLVNERHGVSILSENTGAHEELGEFALSVNPFDVQELADALYSALMMSPEARERRATGLKEIVTSRDPGDWIDEQIADIRAKHSHSPELTLEAELAAAGRGLAAPARFVSERRRRGRLPSARASPPRPRRLAARLRAGRASPPPRLSARAPRPLRAAPPRASSAPRLAAARLPTAAGPARRARLHALLLLALVTLPRWRRRVGVGADSVGIGSCASSGRGSSPGSTGAVVAENAHATAEHDRHHSRRRQGHIAPPDAPDHVPSHASRRVPARNLRPTLLPSAAEYGERKAHLRPHASARPGRRGRASRADRGGRRRPHRPHRRVHRAARLGSPPGRLRGAQED